LLPISYGKTDLEVIEDDREILICQFQFLLSAKRFAAYILLQNRSLTPHFVRRSRTFLRKQKCPLCHSSVLLPISYGKTDLEVIEDDREILSIFLCRIGREHIDILL